MADVTSISSVLQAELSPQKAGNQKTGKDFVSVLERIQKQESVLDTIKRHDESRNVHENLQTRFEQNMQDIQREASSGLNAINQNKAMVTLVNQDFWRQAFSPAIDEHERNSTIPMESDSTATPVLTPHIFDTGKPV